MPDFTDLERSLGAVLYHWRGINYPFDRLHLDVRTRYYEQARTVLEFLTARGWRG